MNKLLLLATTILVSLTFYGYSADIPLQGGQYYKNTLPAFGDSTIKGSLSDTKGGFKDLFVSESANGINLSKLNPRAINFVQDYIDNQGDRLNRMKVWGRPYFDLISTILIQHGLPAELKYLSVIESDLKSTAVSWVGAVGPWQFMPNTARILGLKVNQKKDERTDYYKSTHAAARYLTELYGLFNDWLLVIAAYNGGPGIVYSAIRKSKSRNFWDLQYYLPAESRTHVKKFIATHYIMEGDGGLTTLTKKETDNLTSNQPVSNNPDNSKLTISGKYNSIAIAQNIQMSYADFEHLNPNFDKQLADNGSYDMHLPAEKMALFQSNKSQILEQSIRFILSTVSR
jgi:membrane-bound lytic murein transglycosylase D